MLRQAEKDLQFANLMLKHSANEAGRYAYMATFNAAQAALVQVRGIGPKTHKGVRSEFGKLCKEHPDLNPEMGQFLASVYKLKEVADYRYEIEVPGEEAKAAIDNATGFLATIKFFLKLA